jgi:hypothetical protein
MPEPTSRLPDGSRDPAEPHARWSAPRWIWALLLVGLAVAGLWGALQKGTTELPVYVRAAERMVAGQRIHVAADAKPFTYPPFFALPFLPYCWMGTNQSTHRTVWYLTNLLTLAAVIVLTDRGVRQAAGAPAAWKFWIPVLVLAARHVSAVFENQSHDLLVFAAVLAALPLAARGAWPLAAVLLGLGAACKATPLLFLPYLLWKRQWLAALVLPLAFAGFSLLPEVWFHSDSGRTFVEDWYRTFLTGVNPVDPDRPMTADSAGAWHAWNYLNQSLSGTLYRLATPVATDTHTFDVSLVTLTPRTLKLATQGALAALLVLFLAAIGWTRNKAAAPSDRLRLAGEFALILCGMVLFSPMSSKSHFCVLLLADGFLVARLLRPPPDRSLWALVALLVPVTWLTMRGLIGVRRGVVPLAYGAVTWIALLTALGVAWVLFQERRRIGRPA